MKRANILMLLGLLSCGWMSAQNTSIQIGTNPTGAVFVVDGTPYTATQVFNWPSGSAHVVQFPLSMDAQGDILPYQVSTTSGTHYQFNDWSDNAGLLLAGQNPNITITANASLTSLIANLTPLFEVNLVLNGDGQGAATGCGGAPGNPNQLGPVSGVVYIDGTCFSNTSNLYIPGGTHILNAFPYPGWVFYSWDINGNTTTSALTSINVTTGINITPFFSVAKQVQFLTNPLGLNILLNGETIQTSLYGPSTSGTNCTPVNTNLPPDPPSSFPPLCIGQVDLLPGSSNHLAAVTPQLDANANAWVFAGFSNGLGQNGVYTPDSNVDIQDTVTANFIPGERITINTSPVGLPLVVDGRSNWPAYNFIWGQGETHTISAPAQATDATGRVWVFASWSNAGPATQTLTVPGNGMFLTATYTELEQVTVSSNPPGLTFVIDGSNCTTPCALNKAAASQSQITIPGSIPSTPSSRNDFISWSDGSTATSRTVTFNQNSLTLTANYQTSYLLTASSNPANTATFQFSPPSPDGFYAAGTQVSVTVTANTNYKFAHWDGDLSGAYATGTLSMSTPHNVIADTVSAPSPTSAGIETAAGPTPDGSVAAGSLIAIYGQNFAPAFQLGPSNPLAQSIGNVTVTANNQLLPLLFVSPGQLAAQVPWEVQPGTYNLAVHTTGQPDVDGTMIVARDAPAIFTQPNSQNLPLILALHQDGSVITLSSPARPNEQISIYGTGFGPFSTPIPDGFPPSGTNTYTAVDPITITAGAVQVQPDSATAAAGMVGMTIVKMTITSAFPSATTVNLTVTVNGKVSTAVTLPLQ
jgi:uncharacterized protein (TIGR03437 family)